MQTTPPETPPQPSSQQLGQNIVKTVASSPLKQSAVPSSSKTDELLKLRCEPVVSIYGNSPNPTEDVPAPTKPERQNFDNRPKRTAKTADWFGCLIQN